MLRCAVRADGGRLYARVRDGGRALRLLGGPVLRHADVAAAATDDGDERAGAPLAGGRRRSADALHRARPVARRDAGRGAPSECEVCKSFKVPPLQWELLLLVLLLRCRHHSLCRSAHTYVRLLRLPVFVEIVLTTTAGPAARPPPTDPRYLSLLRDGARRQGLPLDWCRYLDELDDADGRRSDRATGAPVEEATEQGVGAQLSPIAAEWLRRETIREAGDRRRRAVAPNAPVEQQPVDRL